MQAFYAPQFEREMGLTQTEFERCLPEGFEPHPVVMQAAAADGDAHAQIALNTGQARLSWRALPPRSIALMRMPRLYVRFDFGTVDADERFRAMKHFDLVMLRGGG
jgi:hypothetical protein